VTLSLAGGAIVKIGYRRRLFRASLRLRGESRSEWKRQDGVIRQQVIEQLMQQIMHYDAEFRREDATSVSSSAKH
jgi:hypothetical protein